MSNAMSATNLPELDLVVDLNGEDESGLPWGFVDEARDRALLRVGTWLVVGEGNARAVAQFVEIDGDVVRVRPLPGPVSKHHGLLGNRVA
jgi:hypothetical protein